MSRFLNYFYRFIDAFRNSGLQGIHILLKRSYLYRLYWPLMFVRTDGSYVNMHGNPHAGTIEICTVSIRLNRWAMLLKKKLAMSNWRLALRIRHHDSRADAKLITVNLDHFPESAYPLDKTVPLQIPEIPGGFILEAFIQCDYQWLKDSRWLLGSVDVQSMPDTNDNNYSVQFEKHPGVRFLTVRMDVSEGCNLGCRMCNIRHKRTPKKEIDTVLFDKIRRELFPYAHTVFLSCGREPLMVDNIGEYLRMTRSAGVSKIELITNGMLLSPETCEALVSESVYRVTVSLDSPDEQVLAGIRPGAELTTIIQNIRTLQSVKKRHGCLRPHIRLNLVLQKKNIRDLLRYLDLGMNMRIKEFRFQHLVVFSTGMDAESLFHNKQETNYYLRQAADYAFIKNLKLELPKLFTEHDVSGEESYPDCYGPWESIIIEPDGRVIPCCSLDMISMGNLRDESFPAVWNGKRYRRLRQALFTKTNSDCLKYCLAIEAGDPDFPQSIFRQQLNVSP